MIAHDIKVECEEDGFYLVLDTTEEDSEMRFWISEPEQLYDRVKAAILPWLMERDEAGREYNERIRLARDVLADAREAYEASSPKHPDFHSVHADIYDNRDKC